MPLPTLLVQTARVLGAVIVHARPAILDRVEQIFLYIPVVLLCADRELEVFARYGIPVLKGEISSVHDHPVQPLTYLVDHHDSEEIANGCEKEPVKIMLYTFADLRREDIDNDLADDKEEDAKGDMAEWPAVL